MRILCVCSSGHVRSVTLARLLDKRGHEAQACGLKHRTALPLLCEWAEAIYFLDWPVRDELLRRFAQWAAGDHAAYRRLVFKLAGDYVVGPDDWKVPDHPDLLALMRGLVEAQGPHRRPQTPFEAWEAEQARAAEVPRD